MATRRERDLDAALAALAGEVAEASPLPGAGLSGAVLTDAALSLLAREVSQASPRPGNALTSAVTADAALEMLARDGAETSPRPDEALIARVLADAASVAAAATTTATASAPVRRARPARVRRWFVDLVFGWQGGAVAAMLLALVAGLGVGLEMQPGALPLIEAREAPTTAPISLAALATGPFGPSGL